MPRRGKLSRVGHGDAVERLAGKRLFVFQLTKSENVRQDPPTFEALVDSSVAIRLLSRDDASRAMPVAPSITPTNMGISQGGL